MKNSIRGSFLDFIGDPFKEPEQQCVRYIEDGLLVIEEGQILEFGDYIRLREKYPEIETVSYKGQLIIPGLIDAHVHYPQLKVIASYGEKLLDWLKQYVFPEERKFEDREYAREVATFFLEELLRNGTTTAVVLCTTHPESVDVFFQEAFKRNLRMIAGKMMMDRNAPAGILETPGQSREDCDGLINRWHDRGRLSYALTPRFAISCTPEMLTAVAQLKERYPDVYIHTHLSETKGEIKETLKLFPGCSDYLEVYDKFSLVTDRSLFAHGIHLSDSEFERLSQAGATVTHCPTANLFLGSGLFSIGKAKVKTRPIHVAIGTDVGAGTSLSLFKTLDEAYKVASMNNYNLTPFQAFYLATLGGAESLSLADKIGNFMPGKEADFVVLDFSILPILKFRHRTETLQELSQLEDLLFSLMVLGDDRVIQTVYIMGKKAL